MGILTKLARKAHELTYHCYSLAMKIESKEHRRVLDQWIKDKGERGLRVNHYELETNSIVFDLGGYKGDWASDIVNKFNSIIYVFEPVKQFYDEIVNRFTNNEHVIPYNFALGKGQNEFDIYLNNEGSSFLKNRKGDKGFERAIQKDFIKFAFDNKIEIIDLLKINIEGGEFELMEYLIENNFHLKVKNFQIQFHNFFQAAPERRRKIQEKLLATHEQTYSYEWVWENWKLKQ